MKVEVFKMVEVVDDHESVSFSREKYQLGYFGGMKSEREFRIENFKVKTIVQQKAISNLMPREYKEIEVSRLVNDGFHERKDNSYRYPHLSFYEKVKKIVIADKMVDEAFVNIEKINTIKALDKIAVNLLLIDNARDVNKITYDLNSQSEVLDNYREEYQRLERSYLAMKRMNLFQRIFMWKKSINGK